MKNHLKKLLSWAITLCIALTLFPGSALAAGETVADPEYELYYVLCQEDGTAELPGGNGVFYVEAGKKYTAKVFMKPSQDLELAGFELYLTYNESSNISVKEDTTAKKYDSYDDSSSGTIVYELMQVEWDPVTGKTCYSVPAGTEYQLAQFTFEVRESLAVNTPVTFGFDTKSYIVKYCDDTKHDVGNCAKGTSAAVEIPSGFRVSWTGGASGFASVELPTVPQSAVWLVAAFYNGSGKMVGVEMERVANAASISVAVSETPARVCVFLLDSGNAPCAARSETDLNGDAYSNH